MSTVVGMRFANVALACGSFLCVALILNVNSAFILSQNLNKFQTPMFKYSVAATICGIVNVILGFMVAHELLTRTSDATDRPTAKYILNCFYLATFATIIQFVLVTWLGAMRCLAVKLYQTPGRKKFINAMVWTTIVIYILSNMFNIVSLIMPKDTLINPLVIVFINLVICSIVEVFFHLVLLRDIADGFGVTLWSILLDAGAIRITLSIFATVALVLLNVVKLGLVSNQDAYNLADLLTIYGLYPVMSFQLNAFVSVSFDSLKKVVEKNSMAERTKQNSVAKNSIQNNIPGIQRSTNAM